MPKRKEREMGGFFYDETNRDKLIVLYCIKSLNIEMTRDQFADFCVEYDLIPYFDLQTTIGELEESGLLAAVPKAFGQAYMLTAEGEQVLEMFQERIPQSRRDMLDFCANRSRDKILLDTQYSAKAKEACDGGYTVTLKSMESNRNVLAIEILMPDTATANSAIRRWRESSVDIYKYLMNTLTAPRPDGQKDQQEKS